jgi:hypothetical protein
LAIYTHVAWTTGAHRVDQADWHELTKLHPEHVVVVPDNDDPGRAAVPLISQQLKGVPLMMVQWDADWPIGFDLADPFPAKLFDKASGRYTGPQVNELLLPATWATDIKGTNDNGKPIIVLRPEFVKPWRYVHEVERFVHLQNPARTFRLEALNLAIAPFSHPGINVAKALSHQINEPIATLTYRPDKVPAITVHTDQGLAINQFRPSWLRPMAGDVAPWLNYAARLFPVKSDCKQVLR